MLDTRTCCGEGGCSISRANFIALVFRTRTIAVVNTMNRASRKTPFVMMAALPGMSDRKASQKAQITLPSFSFCSNVSFVDGTSVVVMPMIKVAC